MENNGSRLLDEVKNLFNRCEIYFLFGIIALFLVIAN